VGTAATVAAALIVMLLFSMRTQWRDGDWG
jgi:hypothetical protein